MMAVRLRDIRQNLRRSRRQMNRARRLYARLIRSEVKRNPESVWIYAQRARRRGLFAGDAETASNLKSIVCSILRHIFQIDRKAYPGRWEGSYAWYRWLDDNPHTDWFSLIDKKKLWRNGKPVLRLIA